MQENVRTFCFLFLLVTCTVFSQEEEKTNPVLFAEVYAGAAGGEAPGMLYGAGFNYQKKKNLYTLRYTGTLDMGISYAGLGLFPFPVRDGMLDEVAILYGRRRGQENHSVSFSLGPAFNRYRFYEDDEQKNASSSIGLAFETNIKWFKKEKRRYRIYGLIPVGKPTAFGTSYGFKLSGNISQTWYTGLSVIASWGWHKKY